MQFVNVDLPKTYVACSDNNYLVHQIETRNALKRSNIVINDNYTGSGKTIASALYLLDLKDYHTENPREFFSVLYVSPINSLLYQTYQDIQQFVSDHNLPFVVFPIMKYTMDLLEKACQDQYQRKYSRGELLSELFNNPISILREIQIVDNTIDNLRKAIVRDQKPCIYIINPDILYYSIFVHYHEHRNNIKLGLMENIKYIVFDEFHYYTFYQLNMFFFMLSLWKINRRLELNTPTEIKICLLSATPNKFINDILNDSLQLHVEYINETSIFGSEYYDHNELFLTDVQLSVYKLEPKERFIDAMQKDIVIMDIIDKLDHGKYGLIVCNSIEDVQKIKRFYHELGIESATITGSITQEDRKENVESHLIISTNTVDLGFNFNRKRKSKRQNIDFIYIDYITYDDFIQRIGRVGRILKKQNQNQMSYANVFLSDQAFSDFQIRVDLTATERSEILSQFASFMPEKFYGKEFFEKYGFIISYIGYQELLKYSLLKTNNNSIQNDQDEIVEFINEKFLELLKDVYNVQSNYYNEIYQKYLLSQKKFDSFTESDNYDLLITYLFDKEYHSIINGNGYDYLRKRLRLNISDSNLFETLSWWRYSKNEDFYQKFYSLPIVRQYHEYLCAYFNELKQNFRGSDFELTMNISDPNNIFGSDEYDYSIFHIIKHYEYDVIQKKEDNVEKNIILINDYLETSRKFYFELDFTRKNMYDVSDTLYFMDNAGELCFIDNHPNILPEEFNALINTKIIVYFFKNDDPYNTYLLLKTNNLLRIPSFDATILFRNDTQQYKMYVGKFALFVKNYFDNMKKQII